MMRVFEVKTTQGAIWQGVAADFNTAEQIAMNVFLCPKRSIVSIKVVKIID